LWLQEDPEATAKSLFERLERAYPGRFAEGQLRTLQRRIREWRRVMARELVYACVGQEGAGQGPVVIGSDAEAWREQSVANTQRLGLPRKAFFALRQWRG
jgi:hypothetical protein